MFGNLQELIEKANTFSTFAKYLSQEDTKDEELYDLVWEMSGKTGTRLVPENEMNDFKECCEQFKLAKTKFLMLLDAKASILALYFNSLKDAGFTAPQAITLLASKALGMPEFPI